MPELPRPRRPRGRRRRAQPPPRPTQAPAPPEAPREAARPGQRAQRKRSDRARADRGRTERAQAERGRARRGRGRPRQPAGERADAPALILLDAREGGPDLSGAAAIFEGYFDPETGERRGAGAGIPRLRVGNEKVWGFECWWRLDPGSAGLTPEDQAAVETSKRLLRGLLRDARRAGRVR